FCPAGLAGVAWSPASPVRIAPAGFDGTSRPVTDMDLARATQHGFSFLRDGLAAVAAMNACAVEVAPGVRIASGFNFPPEQQPSAPATRAEFERALRRHVGLSRNVAKRVGALSWPTLSRFHQHDDIEEH